MGNPVRIADLAKRMIKLSGAKDIEIKYTGLRAGEKLYEEVLNELEGTKPTFHEKIRIAEVRQYDYDEVNKDIEDLVIISRNYDDMETVRKMKQIVPEYIVLAVVRLVLWYNLFHFTDCFHIIVITRDND